MAVDGALGDEQARPDLLVAQAVGDQPCDFCFPLPEWPRALTGLKPRRQHELFSPSASPIAALSAQACSGLELGLESRMPQAPRSPTLGLGQQRGMDRDDACAGPGSHGFGSPEQLRREPRLA